MRTRLWLIILFVVGLVLLLSRAALAQGPQPPEFGHPWRGFQDDDPDTDTPSGTSRSPADTAPNPLFALGQPGTSPHFVQTFGTINGTNSAILGTPWGISVASDNSIYVAENSGFRLIKFGAVDNLLWAVGTAGVSGSDSTHFNFPEGITLDSAGHVYVADAGNHRIQIYNPDGSFSKTFGNYGSGAMQLDCPAAIAISPLNGDVYIADRCNHRIQVYDGSLSTNKATLGWTGVSGSDSSHFNSPYGVAMDTSGNVYVADTNNQRIQKCTVTSSGGTCVTFVGQTGISGSDLNRLNNPVAVTLDGLNRLFIVDRNNNRIQVFDAMGAYLATIGGSSGTGLGQLRTPSGVAVDRSGNIFVADSGNGRIEEFAPGVPGWKQININGFGSRANQIITTLAPFKGRIYAGTFNWGGSGAQLWRWNPGSTWDSIISPGFGLPTNVGIDHLIEFNGNLYAGTWNEDLKTTSTQGGQVWRYDGQTFSQIALPGFDPTNGEIFRFAVFNQKIYASTWSYSSAHGVEIWRSDTGASGSWSRVAANGFGDPRNSATPGLAAFNGYLYAGTYNWSNATWSSGGAQVWRSQDGTTWKRVNTNGFGDPHNMAVHGLVGFNGYLYVAGSNYDPISRVSSGGKIWRCAACDGSDWRLVVGDGFHNANNNGVDSLVVFDNALYVGTSNPVTGMEIWSTADGTAWSPVMTGGFGTSNNAYGCWDNAAIAFDTHLFYGTNNKATGGQIWESNIPVYSPVGHPLYLPFVGR